MANAQDILDILIIGAGPAGISCAIEAQRAGLQYLLLDKGSIADSIQKFQREMFFFSTPELLELGNIPFIVPTTRPTSLDCVNYYRGVAEHFALNLELYCPITSLKKEGNIFIATSAEGKVFRATYVVVATGYYDTPTPLGIEGENLPHVTHFYRDALPFYKRNVLVVGGKNSAVEAALDLYRHGANVTVIHRGETLSSGVKYWILPDFENRVKAGSITLHLATTAKKFLQGSTVVQKNNGEEFSIPTDDAFILIGYLPDVALLKKFGIAIENESLVPQHSQETYETNVSGLYVAGGLVGGRFNNRVFIENGREHGKHIIASIVKKNRQR